jgi:hypothetical protein
MSNDKPSATPDYRAQAAELGDLVTSKQRQYGDSATRSAEILAVLYPDGLPRHAYRDVLLVVRVLDKLSRIAQRGADRQDLGGESPWRDVAGYGLLGAAADARRERPDADGEASGAAAVPATPAPVRAPGNCKEANPRTASRCVRRADHAGGHAEACGEEWPVAPRLPSPPAPPHLAPWLRQDAPAPAGKAAPTPAPASAPASPRCPAETRCLGRCTRHDGHDGEHLSGNGLAFTDRDCGGGDGA